MLESLSFIYLKWIEPTAENQYYIVEVRADGVAQGVERLPTNHPWLQVPVLPKKGKKLVI
jgi:hypothetical protein